MDSPDAGKKSLADLVEVMASLRTPNTGCPWDLEQSFATIAPYTIEEAYEVADAISRNDLIDLEEELGDLLFQVVYHARMAEEQNAFDLTDVVDGITRKMIRRHPHVFGTDDERRAGAAPGFWERIKDGERAAKAARRAEASSASGQDHTSTGAPPHLQSVLDNVPVALPSLTRAVKLQNKAARVGFDWPSLAPVFAKMREELAELEETLPDRAINTGGDADTAPVSKTRQMEEFGDLLFVMANVARHLDIDPEAALSGANAKFTRRFQSIETALAKDNRAPTDSTLDEMDALWDAAKRDEKS